MVACTKVRRACVARFLFTITAGFLAASIGTPALAQIASAGCTLNISGLNSAQGLVLACTSAPYTCGSSYAGVVYFNTSSTTLLVCDGSAWQTVNESGLTAGLSLGTSTSAANPSRSGEVTTGLFTPASGAVSISSLGSEVMRVTGTGLSLGTSYAATAAPTNGAIIQGNVGIGTNTPGATLHVYANNSAIYLGDTSNSTSYANFNGRVFVGYNGANAVLQGAGTKGLQLGVNNSTFGSGVALTINSNGQVGIGTSAPSNKLDVAAGVAIGTSYVGVATAPANGAIIQGNVGIGTNAPANALDVPSGNINALSYTLGGFSAFSNISGNLAINSTAGAHGVAIYPGSNGAVAIQVQNGTGKVGIGTATPQATLDVNGYARLAKNASQPVACAAGNDGAIALNHNYTLCICNGGSTSWVQASDGVTACSW